MRGLKDVGELLECVGLRRFADGQRRLPVRIAMLVALAAMILQEIHRAFRALLRAPRLSSTVIVTLALAVGGAGALLSLFNAVVLRPLPVREPERLVAFFPALGDALLGIPGATLAELRRQQRVFEDLCGITRGAVEVELSARPVRQRAHFVTGPCHRTLGVEPFLGRLLDEKDAPIGGRALPSVVVSHGFWTRALGGDPRVVGRTLRAQGMLLTIVGVTPPGVDGFDADEAPDLTLPLGLQAAAIPALHGIGRLREGATVAAARSDITELWPRVWAGTNVVAPGRASSPAASPASLRIEPIARGISTLREQYAQPLAALCGLSALLLLLACANVGGLLLARASARARELAVQAALGASRGRLSLQVGAEGVMLSLGAAASAIPMAWWVSRLLAATMWTRRMPLSMEVAPDGPVLAAIGAAGLAAGLAVSLPPLALVGAGQWQLSSRARAGNLASSPWRRALLVSQVAVSLVLVFCALLFGRNLSALRSLNPGYSTDALRWTDLELPFGRPRDIDLAAYFRPLLERLNAVPQVTNTALATAFPTTEMRHVAGLSPFSRGDREPGTRQIGGTVDRVSPDFFATVGIPVLQGREFAWSDAAGRPPVAVINAALASRLFPDSAAVGQRVRIDLANQVFTVVGVAGDASPGDARIGSIPMVYLPLLQNAGGTVAPNVILRAPAGSGLEEPVRVAIESFGRHRVGRVRTIEDQTDLFFMRERVLSGVSSSFAVLSLLVGSLGLYALLAHSVLRRTKELAIRMALGATRRAIFALVMREGFAVVALGVGIGLPLAFAAARAARVLLYEPSLEAMSLGAAVAVLAAAALAACAVPARRALRTQPADTLRAD